MNAAGDNGFAMSNWTTQVRKGLLELSIVSFLSRGEMYGYDLVKRLTEIPGLMLTEGTAYPLLSRLRKAGLIAGKLRESSHGPARKYYVLTDEGRRAMRLMSAHWLDIVDGIAALLDGQDASPQEGSDQDKE